MTVAFIHYHLKPGGVTRVIEQQAQVCRLLGWDYCILAGENPLELENVYVIEELHYDLHRSGLGEADKDCPPDVLLADMIESAISRHFCKVPVETADIATAAGSGRSNKEAEDSCPRPCVDLIHVHNATLAKNSDLLPALSILKSRGSRLFLQLHDFAEDGRPTVYSSHPYPGDVHYGCINSRDLEFLRHAGVDASTLHSIPNLISPLPGAFPEESSLPDELFILRERRVKALYPVRAIRRKNIGEALLLSLISDDLEIGITLEPNNPADKPSYRYWRELAVETGASIQFNVAADSSFELALSDADVFISTSVQEGFGFTFLEPWTLGKAVAGRKIPYVHKDFTDQGMIMDGFYDEIAVPVDFIDMQSFRNLWLQEARRRFSRFRIALRNQGMNVGAEKTRCMSDELEASFDSLYGSKPTVDFARLDPENQGGIVRRCADDGDLRRALQSAVPLLSKPPLNGNLAEYRKTVEHNHTTVYSAYGIQQYANRMQTIYNSILSDRINAPDPDYPDTHPKTYMDKESLLFSFLDPSQIFLISSL